MVFQGCRWFEMMIVGGVESEDTAVAQRVLEDRLLDGGKHEADLIDVSLCRINGAVNVRLTLDVSVACVRWG